MKKFTLFITILVLAAMQAWGESVDATTARSMAQDFLSDMSVFSPQTIPNSGGGPLQLIHAEVSDVGVAQNAYYIFGSASGYVIVAGDDRAQHILGYGNGSFNMNKIPCALQFMLDSYKEQIDYLLEHPGLEVETMSLRSASTGETSVAPLLTAKWNQGVPFNNLCPRYDDMSCYTGCACTSLSQVMYYWKHPSGISYTLPGYLSNTLGIDVSELPPTAFDWDNMIDSYNGSYTEAQANAVAKLMRYVGQAEYMDYGPNGSGAYTSSVATAAWNLGYSKNSQHVMKTNYWSNRPLYSDEEWAEMILTELYAGRPIVYMAQAEDGSGGHGFNLDGYDALTQMYHLNWGWGGYYDGYFALNAFSLSEDGSYAFTRQQSMIIGLEPEEPEPELTVTPSSLDFSVALGETVTKTFTVIGFNLAEDVTLTLYDPEGYYSIDKTRISASEAEHGATVTVTYDPAEVGSSYAEVRVKSRGVQLQKVSLNGEAWLSSTSIEVDQTSIDFGRAYNGYGETRRLFVKAQGLTGNISLRVTGRDSIHFDCYPSTITPAQAAEGVYVPIRLFPYSEGYLSATLILSAPGADDVQVALSGIGIKTSAYIYVDQDTMTMASSPNVMTTKYLQVVYHRFNGWIASPRPVHVIDSLSFDPIDFSYNVAFLTNIDGDDCFTVTRTSVIASDGVTDTCLVKVCYKPTKEGHHSAQLKLWSNVAYPVIVQLEGTSILSPDGITVGDVNGDGVVSVNDITFMIDAILEGEQVSPYADVNGDGQISIGDITLLIDLMLSQ